ncbi:uncharacterized protein LOC117338399 [Pecten maximus]|uniref:uncharacterized protein LOC117338399 n=1 Tax=Pecten maximus TaxID=6579 RepID=UPI0014581D88|nr:uncharacterized protein LOC117338399 [Pecten maximus]XP_033755639.1 uncharacterized protein LOC117338399 [Pecten maximus]
MEWYTLLPFVTILLVCMTEGRSPPMCEHDGMYYTDGETVTYGCTTAMCYRGRKWRITKAKCLFRDRCLRDGQTVNAGECQTVQCRINKRMTKTKLVYKTDCPWKGDCIKNRETWMEGCFKYRCRAKKDTAKVEIVKKGCEWEPEEKCYKLNTIKTDSCMQYQCQEDSNGAVGFVLVRPACVKIGSRGCAKPKEEWWDFRTCSHYKCVILTDDNGNVVGAQPQVEQGCEYEGKCYGNGEHFDVDDGSCYCSNGELMCVGKPVTAVTGRSTRPPITVW